jgi:two-component system cell cycle response regulator
MSQLTSKPMLQLPHQQAEASNQVTKPFRVIVADDDSKDRLLLQYVLVKWGFEVYLASDGLEAWELLQSEDVPTIAILDRAMPNMDGIELCHKIRSIPRRHYTYIVFVTGMSEKQHMVSGLRAGADDYLAKPFDADELQGRLLVAERILSVQEQLMAAHEHAKFQAIQVVQDCLTQLLNRAGIMDALNHELSRSHRSQEPFAVIMADVDHFKHINDTYGHPAGDEVLCEVATRIKTSLRTYDSVGRVGGEEFLGIVPGCDESTAFQVAEKIRHSVGSTPVKVLGEDRTVTISLGVSARVGETSAVEMLSAADAALYQAKASGRNCTKLALSERP